MNRHITAILFFLLLIITASFVSAEEVLQEFSWMELKENGRLAAGKCVPAKDPCQPDCSCLEISNPSGNPLPKTLLVVENPDISSNNYALRGRIRYQGVGGKAYLEMLSDFPGGQYFSRTLAPNGPMQFLSGDSSWRNFVLPFSTGEKTMSPSKITFNMVLPDKGRVYISDLQLVQFSAGESSLASMSPGGWWSERSAGLIGGVIGSIIGLLGAMIGLFVYLGRYQGFVMLAIRGILILGIAATVLGGIALIQSQPYTVYYPLLLVGGICIILPLCIKRSARKLFQDKEMSRMNSMDG